MGYIRDEEFMVGLLERKDSNLARTELMANLASASLPGGGFRRIHNNVQSLTQSMLMKVAGIHSEKEAVNFLLGEVPDPWMTHYVDHISFHTRDAFFEVKSYQPNNIRLDPNNKETKPADCRANEVVNQYSNKFKRLDKQYAADIVGDGDNGIVGPFESAQKRFIGGQPLVAGGEDGMLSISPLHNTDRKGGACIIMLQQFRRALGVMVVRGMANHKLSRLHQVRGTAEEAKFTAEANHSNDRWKAGQQRSGSWYSSHTPE
eukprot:scaffold10316_cov71-Cyclotella_meneghiniana.AAC.10